MPESLQTLAAERTRHETLNLIRLLQVTPPEKLHWKPLGCGRSVIAQGLECILVNRKWALTLRWGYYNPSCYLSPTDAGLGRMPSPGE